MKGRFPGGVLLVAVAAFGCGGGEPSQTPEEFAADVQEIQRKALEEAARIQKERLMAGAPPPEKWRQEISKGIDEVEALQGLWFRTLEAVQAAETDQWQKRYARDAVTRARMRKSKVVPRMRASLESAKDVQLRGIDNYVKSTKVQLEADIANAREKVKALGGEFPTE